MCSVLYIVGMKYCLHSLHLKMKNLDIIIVRYVVGIVRVIRESIHIPNYYTLCCSTELCGEKYDFPLTDLTAYIAASITVLSSQ